MKVFKIFFDLEKESNWLEKMGQDGYILRRKGTSYYFDESDEVVSNGVDYRTFKSRNDYEDYLSMFKDTGWDHVHGSKSSGKQYFSKQGRDTVYSDQDSLFQMVKRHAMYWMMISIVLAIAFRGHIATGFVPIKSLFFTPGLWELEGLRFMRSFLFELPFVLIRILNIYGFFIFSGLYLLRVLVLLSKYTKKKKYGEEI